MEAVKRRVRSKNSEASRGFSQRGREEWRGCRRTPYALVQLRCVGGDRCSCLCRSAACDSQCLSCESAAGCTSCRDPAKVLLFGDCQYESCAQQYYLDFSSNTCRGEKYIAGLQGKKEKKEDKTKLQVLWLIIGYLAV